MLYIGHFSFDELGSADNARHGYFTCLVDAPNAADAVSRFKTRITDIKKRERHALFDNIKAVYLEELTEVQDVPSRPVLTRFQSSEGPFPKSKSCTLPAGDAKRITPYEWRPDQKPGREPERDAEGYKESTPFLSFEENAS